MNRSLLVLWSSLLSLSVVCGQAVEYRSLPTTFGGISFDSVWLTKADFSRDNIKLEFGGERDGAIRRGKSLKTGGGDAVRIRALIELNYNLAGEKTGEKVQYVDAGGGGLSSYYEILEEPIGRNLKPRVLATSEETVATTEASRLELGGLGLGKSIEADKPHDDDHYYANALSYRGGTLKEFNYVYFEAKNTSDKEASVGKQLVAMVAPYHKTTNDVDLGNYHGTDKKRSWIKLVDPFTDPQDGFVYAVHGLEVKGDKTAKYNEYYQQEIAVFGPQGRIVNRIELQQDKPWEVEKLFPIYAAELQGIGFIQKEVTKKFNSAPDPQARQFYYLNPKGQLVYKIDFKVEDANDQMVLRPMLLDGELVLLMSNGQQMSAYHIKDQKLVRQYRLKGEGEANMVMPPFIGTSTIATHHLPGKGRLQLDELHNPDQRILGNEVRERVGYQFYLFNDDNTLEYVQTIMANKPKAASSNTSAYNQLMASMERPVLGAPTASVALRSEPNLYQFAETDQETQYLLLDKYYNANSTNANDMARAVSIIEVDASLVTINKQTLVKKVTPVLPNGLAAPRTYGVYEEQGKVMLLLRNPTSGEYTLAIVR